MKFSILIPVYKNKYLEECIDSVLSQSYTDFEVIVVNDASPYDIDSVIALYHDSRIKYYKNEKGYGAENVADNWNKCLSYANGDYTICIGDDDKLFPNCLELYNKKILQFPDKDIYHIRTAIINEYGDIVDLQEARPEQESLYSLIWHRINNKRIQFIGDFCFKTKTLLKHGGFYNLPYACFSDDITVFLVAQKKGIVNIGELGFQYRKHSQTISNTQNLRSTIISVEKATNLMKRFMIEKSEKEIDELHRTLVLTKLPSYKKSMCLYCIQTDIRQNPISFFYWIGQSAKYGIGNKLLWFFFKNSIKDKIKKFILP